MTSTSSQCSQIRIIKHNKLTLEYVWALMIHLQSLEIMWVTVCDFWMLWHDMLQKCGSWWNLWFTVWVISIVVSKKSNSESLLISAFKCIKRFCIAPFLLPVSILCMSYRFGKSSGTGITIFSSQPSQKWSYSTIYHTIITKVEEIRFKSEHLDRCSWMHMQYNKASY